MMWRYGISGMGMNWLYTAAVNGSSYAMYRLAKELSQRRC